MKTVIISHGDGDGVTSAAIVKAAYDGEVFFSHPAGLFKDLREQVKPGNRVVICDIALSELHLMDVINYLKMLNETGEVIYIDHHPFPETINKEDFPGILVHEEGPCAAELAYRFLEDKLEEDMVRVALFGAISDYALNTDFVYDNIWRWDIRSLFFEAGVLVQGLEGSRRMYDFKRIVVRHLASNGLPSQLSELVIRALIESVLEDDMRRKVMREVKVSGGVAYILNPGGSLGKAARYAAIYGNRNIGLAGEVRGNFIDLSLRELKPGVDLNKILREVSRVLGVHGGGHKMAAGARVPVKLFHRFLEELNKRIKET